VGVDAMSKEPVTWDSEYFDHVEELLDALSDGYGINAPGEEDEAHYEKMLADLRDARMS
jgi:hypothetical protein